MNFGGKKKGNIVVTFRITLLGNGNKICRC